MRTKMKTEVARTKSAQIRGLMFRRGLNHALLFPLGRKTKRGAAIHSFFVFFPFDVAWLDENFKVVDLREKIQPFTPSAAPAQPCAYILELPAGTLKKKGLRKGSKVSFLDYQ